VIVESKAPAVEAREMTIMESNISIAADLLRMEALRAVELPTHERWSNKPSVVTWLLPSCAPRQAAESEALASALPAYEKWWNKPSVGTWLNTRYTPREAAKSEALASELPQYEKWWQKPSIGTWLLPYKAPCVTAESKAPATAIRAYERWSVENDSTLEPTMLGDFHVVPGEEEGDFHILPGEEEPEVWSHGFLILPSGGDFAV